MIYGVQASQPDSGGSATPDYSSATAVMDFILGIYSAGDLTFTLDQVVAEPQYITANGLSFDYYTSQGPMELLPGAIFDIVRNVNWTLVFEWYESEVSGRMTPLSLQDDATVGTEDLWIDSSDTAVFVYDQPSPGTSREAGTSVVPLQPGTRRLAITRTPERLSISLNGGAVVTDTTPSLSPYFEQVGLGGDVIHGSSDFLDMYGYIRRIIVYPPQSDSALPSLSIV